jgi:hypothetical protein
MMGVASFGPRHYVAAALVFCVLFSTWATSAEHRSVMLNMQVTLDQVSQERTDTAHTHVGQVDRLRIVYDPAAVDPTTHRVPLLNFQHWVNGRYDPPQPDPAAMPMTEAWLDLGAKPYRMHFRAAVVHGSPILIEVDEVSRRLTIHPQDNLKSVLISGLYQIDPTPILGASIKSDP